MSDLENYTKDPDSVLDYGFDWSLWLAPGEIITDSTMTVSPGLVLDSSEFTDSAAVAWISGGTAGQTFKLSNKIETNQGRVDERSVVIRVTHR